jgi:peptide deformylase
MALRKIVYAGDDILRKHSKVVKEVTPRIKGLIEDMWETMYEYNGVGLSAPQVGILKRIVVIDVTAPPDEEEEYDPELAEYTPPVDPNKNNHPRGTVARDRYELINPEIVESEGETVEDEGCLSVPGETGKVKRPTKVTVKALDGNGDEVVVTGHGLLAKALCHELDHLEGILFTDLVIETEDGDDDGES